MHHHDHHGYNHLYPHPLAMVSFLSTLYPVMGFPPSAGGSQLMRAVLWYTSFITGCLGASGTSGIKKHRSKNLHRLLTLSYHTVQLGCLQTSPKRMKHREDKGHWCMKEEGCFQGVYICCQIKLRGIPMAVSWGEKGV